MKTFNLAIKNLQGKRYQYLIIGVLFFILNICVLTTISLNQGLRKGVEVAKDKLGADIIITSKTDEDKTLESIYDGIPVSTELNIECDEIENIPGVTKWCKRLYLATLEGASCCDNKTQLIAVDADDYLLHALTLTNLQPGAIIIGSNMAGEIGQTVKYYDYEFAVIDVLDKTGTGYDYSGFILYDDAYKITNAKDISAIFISSEDPTLTRNVLNNRFGKNASIYLTDHKIAEYTKTVTSVNIVSNVITIMLIVSSVLAITTIMTLMFLNRRNETGVLILSGFSKCDIHKLFLEESIAVISVSCVLGAIIFYMMRTINGPYLEKLLHCPINDVNCAPVIISLFVSCAIFVEIIIRVILHSFYKQDACTLIKEVN